jgi:integrase
VDERYAPVSQPHRTTRLPKYRHYLPKDLAVVRLDGRDVYLGSYDSPESHEKYRRVVAEWLTNGVVPSPARGQGGAEIKSGLTVNDVILGYIKHAESYYRKNGRETSEVTLIRLSLKVLKQLYGHTPAADFGPLALKAVRQAFMGANLCRREVNRRTGLVKRCFKWAVENELVPPSLHHGLSAVAGLRKGRTGVRESKPVKPVPEAFVDAIRPHVARQVWAMVDLQRLTGMRPGEVVVMRTSDLETTGETWTYTPESHKTEHHGRERKIDLGPKAQEILRPFLRTDLVAHIFQPCEAVREKQVEKRNKRKTRVQPSQKDRRKQAPKKSPGAMYTTAAYRRAITYGCKTAGVPDWHPNQLRHNAATRLRRDFGLDAARVILGHSTPVVTEIYAEVDREKARAIVAQVG